MQIIENLNIKRYTDLRFPTFKYVPKFNTHPSKLIGIRHLPIFPEPEEEFSSLTWQNCTKYLYAIDLFNFGYYWEVHEVLEELWIQRGKSSREGIFLQGLIQLSVALNKNRQSNTRGVKMLADKAIPKLLSQSGLNLGIDIENLIKQFRSFIDCSQADSPIIVLNFH